MSVRFDGCCYIFEPPFRAFRWVCYCGHRQDSSQSRYCQGVPTTGDKRCGMYMEKEFYVAQS